VETLLVTLEASQLSAALRRSLWLYPAINLAHLAGLTMLVGGIGVLDLRIVGFARTVPIRALSRFLTPIAVVGLILLMASGALMFAADPVALSHSRLFLIKMALVAAGVLNALAFRRLFPDEERLPPAARLMAALSLLIWLTAAGLGRWVGYT
jgi:hypothetical protein